jgi:hypothetical protein
MPCVGLPGGHADAAVSRVHIRVFPLECYRVEQVLRQDSDSTPH